MIDLIIRSLPPTFGEVYNRFGAERLDETSGFDVDDGGFCVFVRYSFSPRDIMNEMSWYRKCILKTLFYIVYISVMVAPATAQDIKVYKTDRYGIKNISPSIIIDENSANGQFEVYRIDKYGLRNISPDEIIQKDGTPALGRFIVSTILVLKI